MVRTKGPIFSTDASGSIAKTLTSSNWKGRSYLKKISSPTNNQQPSQLGIRTGMAFLSSQWKTLSAPEQASWNAPATETNITPIAAYNQNNLLRLTTGLALTKEYPAAQTAYANNFNFLFATKVGRHVFLSIIDFAPGNGWTGFLYRSLSNGFTAAPSNLIKCYLLDDPGGFYYLQDTPPASGTWYYRSRGSSPDGTIGPLSNQNSVVF